MWLKIFQCCGYGSWISCLFDPSPLYPLCVFSDTGSRNPGSPFPISERFVPIRKKINFLFVKFCLLKFFPFLLLLDMASGSVGPGSGVKKNQGSGINIPDLQNFLFLRSGIEKYEDPGLTSRICKICLVFMASQGHHNNSCLCDFQLITRHTHVNYCLADEHECVGGVVEHLPKVYGSKNGLE